MFAYYKYSRDNIYENILYYLYFHVIGKVVSNYYVISPKQRKLIKIAVVCCKWTFSYRLYSESFLCFFFCLQVSFFSTSPELSNKQRFEYFTRTIPSDHYQVKAMVDIIRKMGWSYVSIIYEESNYGIKVHII